MSNNDISDTAAKIGRDRVKDSFGKALENKKNKLNETAPEQTAGEKWTKGLSDGRESSLSLAALKIDPPIPLIEDWCRVGDLGFIFARRGLGKTWLAMHLAKGLACRIDVGPWKIHKQCIVLYLDGEMHPGEIKERDNALGDLVENLVYVNHDLLFRRTGLIMNLADPGFQSGALAYCEGEKVEVILLDNLSTLASGIDENKSIDWEMIQPWLLKLRRIGVTVIFVHHAGRNNESRGTSKREDPAAWILRLDAPIDESDEEGAHFISRFTKWRGAKKRPLTYEWTYKSELNAEILVSFKEMGPLKILRNLIETGLDTCALLAEEMELSKGYISRLANRAESQGWLKISGKKYVLKISDGAGGIK